MYKQRCVKQTQEIQSVIILQNLLMLLRPDIYDILYKTVLLPVIIPDIPLFVVCKQFLLSSF